MVMFFISSPSFSSEPALEDEKIVIAMSQGLSKSVSTVQKQFFTELYLDLSLKPEFVEIPRSRIAEQLRDHKVDSLDLAWDGSQFPNTFKIDEPVLTGLVGIMCERADDCSMSEFHNYYVPTTARIYYFKFCQRHNLKCHVLYDAHDNYNRAIKRPDINGIFTDYITMLSNVCKSRSDVLYFKAIPDLGTPYSIFLSNKFKHLDKPISDKVKMMKKSGRVDHYIGLLRNMSQNCKTRLELIG